MAYQILTKKERNDQFLRTQSDLGTIFDHNPYEEETLELSKTFLLVCEGANTEKYYFESFPVPSKIIEVVGGFGGGKRYLVDQAKRLAAHEKFKGYEVWCIFDFDIKHSNLQQKQDFDNAISEAKANDFNVAFSNDCFELWFILHYKLIQSQHHRQEYFDMLTQLWAQILSGSKYESHGKTRAVCEELYQILLPLQSIAINHARQLYEIVDDGRPPHLMNPCSMIFQLVEELNKYLKK